MDEKEWYNNKDLFLLINNLTGEMKETRMMIRKYNGLYDKVAAVKKETNEIKKETMLVKSDVDHIKSVQTGRSSVGTAIRNWGGWIFGLASFLILLSKLL